MATRRHYQDGFTLIELLISMAVLALLMVSATMFYQFMSQNWERTKGNVEQTEREYHDWLLVSEALTATIPKLVIREDEQRAFYFLGDQNGFTGVTSRSVQDPNYPAVYRFFQERDGDSGVKLVYEEAMLKDTVLTQASQQLPFNFRRVVWRNIENVSFLYRGWENLTQRMALTNIDSGFEAIIDFPAYDGVNRRQHPLNIKVNIDGFMWSIDIPDISSELLANSVEE